MLELAEYGSLRPAGAFLSPAAPLATVMPRGSFIYIYIYIYILCVYTYIHIYIIHIINSGYSVLRIIFINATIHCTYLYIIVIVILIIIIIIITIIIIIISITSIMFIFSSSQLAS